jgi:long-chain fatty acid transport protein
MLLGSLALGSGPADATGFYINQQSVRGLGRVNAGVAAAADDSGTIFFNPAGLSQLWTPWGRTPVETDNLMSVGLQIVVPRADYTNAGSTAATPGTLGTYLTYAGPDDSDPTNPTAVPNLYYARRLAIPGAYIGFAINSPFGLASKFESSWFGRYDTREASLQTINLSAVGAYQLTPQWSIGLGIDLQYAKTKLVTAIPNPLVPGGPTPSTDAQVEIEGNDWTPGFNFGVMFTPDAQTRIGLNYRSGISHNVKGTQTTSGLSGPLAFANGIVDASAEVKLPAVVGLGIARRFNDALNLYAQADWYGWDSWKEIRIVYRNGMPDAVRPQNYRDVWAFSLGADYRISDQWTFRGGVRHDRTPTVDAYRDTADPDADRLWLGMGASYRVSKASAWDFALTHVFFRNAPVDITRTFFDGTPVSSAVRIRGDVQSVVNTIAASFTYSF